MDSEPVFERLLPNEYHVHFLGHSTRADGRALHEVRQTHLAVGSISTADGSALVRQGPTTVIAGVKVEVALPSTEAPNAGFLVINFDMPPLCCVDIQAGRPTDEAQALAHRLSSTITGSGALPLSDLVIEEGKLVWVVYLDVVVLDHGGNVFDAALLASLAALQNVRLREVRTSAEGVVVASDSLSDGFVLKALPLSLSFGVLHDYVLTDPAKNEEALLSSAFSVVYLEDGRMAGVHKEGGSPVSTDELKSCFKQAKDRHAALVALLEAAARTAERGATHPGSEKASTAPHSASRLFG